MADLSASDPSPTVSRSERKTGLLSLPPVVLASIAALVLVIGYQLWQLTQPVYPLDLNSVAEKHLVELPGIDETMAEKIVAGRPYKRKDELVRREILTEAQYERIKEQIVARQK